jgi:hypothetical protein
VEPYRYVILDHDVKFNVEAIAFLKSTGLKPKRTSVQSPWQNGIAERRIGSARREILDHVIAINEGHLRRLLREYSCENTVRITKRIGFMMRSEKTRRTGAPSRNGLPRPQ